MSPQYLHRSPRLFRAIISHSPVNVGSSVSFCSALNRVNSEVRGPDLELPYHVVDVVEVSHHYPLVLYHVIHHGQPVSELSPGLVELSQCCVFRLGTSCQTFI